VVTGFTTFSEAISLNKLCRSTSTPFYLLGCSGLYGFFYIDIGPSLTFSYTKKATGTEESETITSSVPLAEYLTKFTDSTSLVWPKRSLYRHDKYLLLGLAACYKLELTKLENIMDTVDDLVKAKGLPEALLQTEDFIELLGKLDSAWGVDFNPTSSVIGAVVSQEVVKLVT